MLRRIARESGPVSNSVSWGSESPICVSWEGEGEVRARIVGFKSRTNDEGGEAVRP